MNTVLLYNLQAPIICHPLIPETLSLFFKLNLATTAAVVFTVHLTAYFFTVHEKTKDVVT